MKLLQKTFYIITLFGMATVGKSQDFPSNAEPGKCYAKCLIPDQYETITEQVLISPASKRIELIPATYKTIVEQVVVKEATKRIEIIPAEFKTIEEEVMISPEKIETRSAS